jgi:hypothetical protein
LPPRQIKTCMCRFFYFSETAGLSECLDEIKKQNREAGQVLI